MKLARATVATAVFLTALLAIYYLHMRFFRVNVVFYAAIADAVFASLIAGARIGLDEVLSTPGRFRKFLLISNLACSGLCVGNLGPTVIDRSLSFYILEKLQQRGGGIRKDRFEDVFTREYLKEHRLMDVATHRTIGIRNNHCQRTTAFYSLPRESASRVSVASSEHHLTTQTEVADGGV